MKILASLFWQGAPLKTIKKEVSRHYADKELHLKHLKNKLNAFILVWKGLRELRNIFEKL